MQKNSIVYDDAHCHLQDARLAPWLDENRDSLDASEIRRSVVNGTQPSDWDYVLFLGNEFESVIPSIGLHPWYVNTVGDDWKAAFLKHIDTGKCAVGEIGLDRWIENHDTEAQKDAFLFQFRRAREAELPVSIHCLRAWSLLLELLEKEGPYEPGFLLHSYGGPREMIESFIALGARFSFSGYFAGKGKRKKRDGFLAVPLDRLLIETDAPDMLGPEPLRAESTYDHEGKAINSPNNLIKIYDFVAKMKGVAVEELAATVDANFRALFRLWEN